MFLQTNRKIEKPLKLFLWEILKQDRKFHSQFDTNMSFKGEPLSLFQNGLSLELLPNLDIFIHVKLSLLSSSGRLSVLFSSYFSPLSLPPLLLLLLSGK